MVHKEQDLLILQEDKEQDLLILLKKINLQKINSIVEFSMGAFLLISPDCKVTGKQLTLENH